MFVSLCAISQVSAEDTSDISDEIVLEDASMDCLQGSEIETDDLTDDEWKSFSVIQQMIDDADENSTLHISGKYTGRNQIIINKDLTIEGDEDYTYFDANGESRIFYITASNVVLKNLVLRNGTADEGGAVWGGSVNHCVIGFCNATYGGALYNSYAYNSMFLANSAKNGGAMYDSSATLCGFGNNTASEGGALYFSEGDYFVDSCYFDNNTADEDGGSICNFATLIVTGSDFSRSKTIKDDGGAIYNYLGTLLVSNSNFMYNSANDDGGAIHANDNTIIRNSYFLENEAGCWGGAMCYGTAYDCQFVDNYAVRNGGGMYGGIEYDCIFSGNSPQNVYNTKCYESIIGQITLSKSGSYFGGTTVSAKVINTKKGTALSDIPVTFKFSNGKSATVYTGSNGVATYKIPFNPGTYKVTATIPSSYQANATSLANIKIIKAPAKLTPKKLTTQFEADKFFKVKLINTKTKKAIGGVKLLLKVYTGKKAKKVYVTTASNGVASYSASKLKVGTHKVKVSIASSQAKAKAKTSKIKVKKAKTVTYAPDGLFLYKKTGKYYFGVANKNTGKLIKGIKLKVKVYTGKKAKTYTLKTNKKGIGTLNTKSLAVGKHKVVVTSPGNAKYKKSSDQGTIEISKKIPTYMGYHYIYTYYSYGSPSSRSINAYVKDMNGNELHKKITITHSSGSKTTGYTGELISIPGGLYGTVTLKFAGDSKYRASTYTINFV